MPTRRCKPLKFADLHCGVGSLRLALEQIGVECVWSFTADTQAARCYRENFGSDAVGSATDIAAHDMLVTNLDECRATTKRRAWARHPYDTILDVVCLRRPSACMLAGASMAANGADLRTVIDELARLGYFVHRAALDARGAGLPLARRTDVVVAFDGETGFRFPVGAGKTVTIDGLLDPNPADRYYISDTDRENLIARRGRSLTNGDKWRMGFVTEGYANELRDAPDSPYDNILIGPDGRWRVLTEREAARLQGVVESFVLHPDRRTASKQVARCIPVPLAAAVAERLVTELRPGQRGQKPRPLAGAVTNSGTRGRQARGSEAGAKFAAASGSVSPLRWYGSLNRYASRIVRLFPKHECYCEVFGGSAAILLSKTPSEIECYNDLDGNLVGLWRVLREPRLRGRLIAMVEMTPFSREVLHDCLSDQCDSDDPVKRAWSFLVTCNQARNGRGVNESDWAYNRSRGGGNRNAWAKLPQRLAEVGQRLKRVQIENLPCEDILRRYDSRDTLFLLDPPYLPEVRASGVRYARECSRADHIRLLRIARGLNAMVAACGYRSDLYDEMLDDWHRTDFEGKSYAGPRTKGRKLPQRVLSVYSNYDPPS